MSCVRHAISARKSAYSIARNTHIVRDRHVIAPPRAAEYTPLDRASRLAQQSLGRVGQAAQDNLVKVLFVLGQVLVCSDGVVQVGLLAPRTDPNADPVLLGPRDDARDFSVEADLRRRKRQRGRQKKEGLSASP